jgi:hypothetical protein
MPHETQSGRGAAGDVALASVAWLAPVHSQQAFKSTVDLVRVPVVVSGKDGLLTRGLTAKDFDVLEDGVSQKIVAFAEGAPGDELPLHLGLLLDVSGSMELDLHDAANAAVQFVTALDEATDVTLVEFASTIRVGRFSRDSYRVSSSGSATRKPTAKRRSTMRLASISKPRARGRASTCSSSIPTGGDSRSKMSFAQLVDALRFSNVLVYAIGYLDNQASSQRVMQQSRLTMLTRETGRRRLLSGQQARLQTAYARILDELGSRYTIGYEPSGPRADGRFHKIQVRLTAPSRRKDIKIRTRSGYLAPVKR